jgi:hypothetical protein
VPDIHAKLCSPSGAEGWFACAGRVVMESSFPDKGNDASDNGTARHEVCALCLLDTEPGRQLTPAAFVGRVMENGVAYDEDWVLEDQDYVDTIRKLAEGGELFVEQVVNFERYTEVPGDSFGTADAIILKPLADKTYELIVGDRKTGYHEVPVEKNKQLQLYALGAYDEHSLVYEISRVRLIIHQRGAREWDCSIEDLLAFGQAARSRAISVVNAVAMHGKVDQAEWERTFLNQNPTEDACRYCKAMATCPSMQRKVQEVVSADFDDIAKGEADMEWMPQAGTDLGVLMAATGLIEDWIKAVRAEVERRLLAGNDVPGFKLVLGKQGNRKWTSEAEATKLLRETFRLPVEKAFDLTLISPTSAEKLFKAGDIGKRQWPKLQPLIGRSDPKPSVAPAADKRDAWVPPNPADDFQPVAQEASDLC